jgi:hypothetical protein
LKCGLRIIQGIIKNFMKSLAVLSSAVVIWGEGNWIPRCFVRCKSGTMPINATDITLSVVFFYNQISTAKETGKYQDLGRNNEED